MHKEYSHSQHQRGASVIEFAIILPVLALFLIGTVELSRFALLHQKVDKTANAMADFLTQGCSVRFADMDGFASTAAQIMRPFAFSGTIIFSTASFRDTGIEPCSGTNVTCINWQYRPIGTESSQIGSVGGNATYPGNYTVLPGQIAAAAEVSYNYEPLIAGTDILIPSLAPQILYKIAIYKPRQVGCLVNPPT